MSLDDVEQANRALDAWQEAEDRMIKRIKQENKKR